MSMHNVAEAQDLLPELIDRVLAGEGVVITRDGAPVVELTPVPKPPASPRRITEADIDWLRANRVGGSPSEDAGTLLSRMRDEDWK